MDLIRSHVVHSTWNESRTHQFPQVVAFRRRWQELGFVVQVTPNDEIRNDVVRLHQLYPDRRYLHTFDRILETNNMRFDFWRFAKLHLDGGIYADVDVEPKRAMGNWTDMAKKHNVTVFFEETTWPNSALARWIVPRISDYPAFPAYATCVVVSPGPGSQFFLDLLDAVDPAQWMTLGEPRRTLMAVGPGHLTKFVGQDRKERQDFWLVSYPHRQRAYRHHGFGTWKRGPAREEKLAFSVIVLWIVIRFFPWERYRSVVLRSCRASKRLVLSLKRR